MSTQVFWVYRTNAANLCGKIEETLHVYESLLTNGSFVLVQFLTLTLSWQNFLFVRHDTVKHTNKPFLMWDTICQRHAYVHSIFRTVKSIKANRVLCTAFACHSTDTVWTWVRVNEYIYVWICAFERSFLNNKNKEILLRNITTDLGLMSVL